MPDVLSIVPFKGPIDAVVTPPGSKSITNRSLLIAALASGESVLRGALLAEDTHAMIDCVEALGARVERSADDLALTITGIGGELANAGPDFFARQSGTTARFMAAVLALGSQPFLLDADDAMRRRPMGDALSALDSLGVTISAKGEAGFLPVEICGPPTLVGSMPTVVIDGSTSSQFTSGLLIAAACMQDGLRIELRGDIVSRPYLDMTVSVMHAFGAKVLTPDDRTFVVSAGCYQSTNYEIEPDASAASYFFALAAICGGSVCVKGLHRDSLQGDVRFVDVLETMGSNVVFEKDAITVTGAPLHGVNVDFSQISDTAQTIAAVAVFADGPTTVTGIGFIRRKETDRIAAVVTELQRLGIHATEDSDGFTVNPGPTNDAIIETYDDHRMAMSMALIGYNRAGVTISDPNCVAKTFPNYFDQMDELRNGISL
ncbi:MAG: 3-phosphoshikimate 1-carboxyvinyltransferase [Actinobacteria bacterium]|uniref:3-phosphoshikimate 1-carboxyvinyltransferase n=1 Tax=freshwater metagenome TaxID=449393 RepID=A0A6J6IS83_9ZZZZ|nr:3-phosphoshikimate 1-carboxyvinyltransferase [Actinomycetota bacterium]MSW33245.1 3-phosphoshikimate 1-carboxyvinyltransferase [Actinomycetota bacterium]MSX34821.1 3-phosphoshikimate 1-carboxyvinyltransferase [Actinomycetota bacterium]MSY26303.1 3-phosphoshikimate 1-carboxyvinyltransferase [Actinomycetota bacterium]MSY34985.1 3-phosphoshikimate 1-carboxyvinyltransferase [Actinomycetota bacterium]